MPIQVTLQGFVALETDGGIWHTVCSGKEDRERRRTAGSASLRLQDANGGIVVLSAGIWSKETTIMPDHEIKQDQKDIQDDKQDLRGDTGTGTPHQVRQDRQDLHEDKHEIHQDRRDDRRD